MNCTDISKNGYELYNISVGMLPSLQIFYELVTRYDISVDQYFFPDKSAVKSTMRRQLDTLLDGMSDKGLHIVTEAAKAVVKVEEEKKN